MTLQLFDDTAMRERAKQLCDECDQLTGSEPELDTWTKKAQQFIAEVRAKQLFETLIRMERAPMPIQLEPPTHQGD